MQGVGRTGPSGGFGTPSKHEGFVATTGIYIQVEAQGDVEKRPEIWLEFLLAEVLPESGRSDWPKEELGRESSRGSRMESLWLSRVSRWQGSW